MSEKPDRSVVKIAVFFKRDPEPIEVVSTADQAVRLEAALAAHYSSQISPGTYTLSGRMVVGFNERESDWTFALSDIRLIRVTKL
jgi:hypothetical protein